MSRSISAMARIMRGSSMSGMGGPPASASLGGGGRLLRPRGMGEAADLPDQFAMAALGAGGRLVRRNFLGQKVENLPAFGAGEFVDGHKVNLYRVAQFLQFRPQRQPVFLVPLTFGGFLFVQRLFQIRGRCPAAAWASNGRVAINRRQSADWRWATSIRSSGVRSSRSQKSDLRGGLGFGRC